MKFDIPEMAESGKPFIIKRDGFSIHVKAQYDEAPNLSYLGEFGPRAEEGAIPHRGHFFNPMNPESAERDYQRMLGYINADWTVVGITVTVYRKGVELGFASLFGIESDSSENFFVSTVEDELIPEALGAARSALSQLIADVRGSL